MSLQVVQGPAGAPWQRPLSGAVDQLVVESAVLAGNPLGDPVRRPLYVYRSPGVVSGAASGVPSVYMLQGFTGQVDRWLGRDAFEPTIFEALDGFFSGDSGPACPECVVVFLDAWTSLGGSQFLNSTATGRYCDYVCDEIVEFVDARYPTAGTVGGRVVSGKSSGGYGAMVLPMLRPDVFGSLISHSGDALFEVCYQPEFGDVARTLRDSFDGSYERFWEAFRNRERMDYRRFGAPLEMYAMAAAYSPDPNDPTRPLLPFETTTGRLIDAVWERWLEHDPVRMARTHSDALKGLRVIHIEAGRSDEYHLDLGAQAFSEELDALGVEHKLTLFDGAHGGINYRYAPAIRDLLRALEQDGER